jgi:long-chain fatty acid transport protein
MSIKLKFLRNWFVAFVLGFSAVNAAYPDGYRNPPPTAEGIGKSGVNMVFVDDASAISYNPANLTLLEGGSAVISATFPKQENTYDNPLNPAGSVDSNDEWIVLPNLYYAQPLGDKGIALGLGVTTPFGQGIDWDSTDVFNPFAPVSIYDGEIKVINFNPSVAFKIGDSISVGVGADIYYSELDFKALVGDIANAPGAPTGQAEADGDDVAVGGNFGVTWNVTDRQRLVFTYRSEVEMDYEGDFDVTPSLVPFPGPGSHPFVNSDFGLEITYPTTIGAGYGIELTDNIRVEANIEWIEWSVNDSQDADLGVNNIVFGGPLSIPQDWDDTITVGVGGDWQFHENWMVRAGYIYLESPIPDSTISPTLPDADRHALSLGLGYTMGAHAIDVAYTYSIYDDREAGFLENQAYPGTYDIDSDLFGLTYSYSF